MTEVQKSTKILRNGDFAIEAQPEAHSGGVDRMMMAETESGLYFAAAEIAVTSPEEYWQSIVTYSNCIAEKATADPKLVQQARLMKGIVKRLIHDGITQPSDAIFASTVIVANAEVCAPESSTDTHTNILDTFVESVRTRTPRAIGEAAVAHITRWREEIRNPQVTAPPRKRAIAAAPASIVPLDTSPAPAIPAQQPTTHRDIKAASPRKPARNTSVESAKSKPATADYRDLRYVFGRELPPKLSTEEQRFYMKIITDGRQAQATLERATDISDDERQKLEAVVGAGLDAKELFITANIRLVYFVYNRYYLNKKTQHLKPDDFIQVGAQALDHALRHFDPDKGTFSTYAMNWIRSYMQREYQNKDRVIRLPAKKFSDINAYFSLRRNFINQYNRAPTDEEIIEYSDGVISEGTLEIVRTYRSQQAQSLNEYVGTDSTTELLDLLSQSGLHGDVVNEITAIDSKSEIAAIIESSLLTTSEQMLLSLLFGIEIQSFIGMPINGPDSPLYEVVLQDLAKRSHGKDKSLASLLGVTRQRVNQMHDLALDKLRNHSDDIAPISQDAIEACYDLICKRVSIPKKEILARHLQNHGLPETANLVEQIQAYSMKIKNLVLEDFNWTQNMIRVSVKDRHFSPDDPSADFKKYIIEKYGQGVLPLPLLALEYGIDQVTNESLVAFIRKLKDTLDIDHTDNGDFLVLHKNVALREQTPRRHPRLNEMPQLADTVLLGLGNRFSSISERDVLGQAYLAAGWLTYKERVAYIGAVRRHKRVRTSPNGRFKLQPLE